MSKEINRPAAIAIVSLIAALALTFGWYMVNREPGRPADAPPPGGSRGGAAGSRGFYKPRTTTP